MTAPGDAAGGEAAADAGLDQKLVWLTLFRIVSVTVLLGGTAVATWRDAEGGVITSALYGLVIGTYLASLASAWWLRQGRALVPLAYAQLVFDVVTATAVVALHRVGRERLRLHVLARHRQRQHPALPPRGPDGPGDGAGRLRRPGAGGRPAGWRWCRGPLLFVHAGAFAATAVLAGYLSEQLRRSDERLAERESELATITALHESIVQSVNSRPADHRRGRAGHLPQPGRRADARALAGAS